MAVLGLAPHIGALYPPGGPGCAGAGWAQRQRLTRVMQMPELFCSRLGGSHGAAPQAECIVSIMAAQCSVSCLLLSARVLMKLFT